MASDIYRADPPSARRMVALDDGLVLIFHRPSAMTHVVSSPVPELLAALGEGPTDLTGLLERLAATHDLDEGSVDGLAAHLVSLEAAGLVARV